MSPSSAQPSNPQDWRPRAAREMPRRARRVLSLSATYPRAWRSRAARLRPCRTKYVGLLEDILRNLIVLHCSARLSKRPKRLHPTLFELRACRRVNLEVKSVIRNQRKEPVAGVDAYASKHPPCADSGCGSALPTRSIMVSERFRQPARPGSYEFGSSLKSISVHSGITQYISSRHEHGRAICALKRVAQSLGI